MKKLLMFTVGVVILVSCKKDYTCECVTKHTKLDDNTVTTTESKVTFLETKKRYVKDNYQCVSYEEQYSSVFYDGIDPVTNEPIINTVDVLVTNDCEITKRK